MIVWPLIHRRPKILLSTLLPSPAALARDCENDDGNDIMIQSKPTPSRPRNSLSVFASSYYLPIEGNHVGRNLEKRLRTCIGGFDFTNIAELCPPIAEFGNRNTPSSRCQKQVVDREIELRPTLTKPPTRY
jgi:hypothetical protein